MQNTALILTLSALIVVAGSIALGGAGWACAQQQPQLNNIRNGDTVRLPICVPTRMDTGANTGVTDATIGPGTTLADLTVTISNSDPDRGPAHGGFVVHCHRPGTFTAEWDQIGPGRQVSNDNTLTVICDEHAEEPSKEHGKK